MRVLQNIHNEFLLYKRIKVQRILYYRYVLMKLQCIQRIFLANVSFGLVSPGEANGFVSFIVPNCCKPFIHRLL